MYVRVQVVPHLLNMTNTRLKSYRAEEHVLITQPTSNFTPQYLLSPINLNHLGKYP